PPCSPLFPYTTLFRSTEFSRSVQGLHVSGIERIINAGWDQVRQPPTDDPEKSYVTAITYYEDRLVQIIDVERVLDLVIGPAPGVDRKSTRLNSSHVKI